jgi:capsular exopolysaccharide synthesis family protein
MEWGLEVSQLVYKQQRNVHTKERMKGLITYFNSDSTVAEQIHSIRANLCFLTDMERVKTILITSPDKNDGKTTTTTNLALSLAQQNAKVLLIDANLRRPSLHISFKLVNEIGLTSILSSSASLEEAIVHTEMGKLDVLPSGPSTFFPSDLLSSAGLERLLNSVQESYDYVLIDSPSVLEVADTKILANISDGVILVFHKGKIGLEKAVEAKKILELANSKILGVILNEK